jgi:hypothetical protein
MLRARGRSTEIRRAAKGYRALLGAMAHRDSVWVVLALQPGDFGDLGLKHRLHHRQSGGHAHRQQALPGGPGDAGHRQRNLLRQFGQPGGVGRVSEANSRYGLHGGPFSFFEVYLAVHPKTYHQAGLR